MAFAASYPQNRPIIMQAIRDLKPGRIMELGIGSGCYGEMIRRDLPGVTLHGVEAFDGYENPRWKCYDRIFRKNILEMKFKPYDLFLAVDIIEHIEKERAQVLLALLPGPVLLSIPWNFDQGEVDGNPLQAHVSKWVRSDFPAGCRDLSNHLSLILLKGA